jgi:toluene monooxygenase system protein A
LGGLNRGIAHDVSGLRQELTGKDDSVLGVRAALNKVRLREGLDPGWVQLVKFHNGALALAEYAGAVAELRMARFGRDSAWRITATLGAHD